MSDYPKDIHNVMTEPARDQQPKHQIASERIDALAASVDALEAFVNLIRGNPATAQKKLDSAYAISLTEFLSTTPARLDNLNGKLRDLIDVLRSALL